MAKIKTIMESTMRMLREEIDKALIPVCEKFDISLKAGNASFAEHEGHFKLMVKTKDKDGNVLDTQSEDFKKYAKCFGLDPNLLGKRFSIGGTIYKVVGLKPNARKYPIVGKRVTDGEIFVFPPNSLNAQFILD